MNPGITFPRRINHWAETVPPRAGARFAARSRARLDERARRSIRPGARAFGTAAHRARSGSRPARSGLAGWRSASNYALMKKASEYRQHAEECRLLAQGMAQGEHRDQLLEMAATWENLARERSDTSKNLPFSGLP